MKDIAEKVGVSTALVSYVLNGLEKEKRVGPEVVKRIHQVAKDLKYKPNQIARSLRRGSTNTIGLIVADISNPFFGQLARVIEDEAAESGYTVVFGSSDENSEKSATLIDILLNRQVDGLIITPSEGSTEQIKMLLQGDIPVVLMDRYLPDISTNRVVLDNFNATYTAVNYFISKGYKKVNMIAYKSSLVHMQERIRGYQEAMKDNGLANEVVVKEISYSHAKSEMEKVMEDLLLDKKIDALLFATNALSISGLYAIRKHHIKVPEELAVIGFDGHEVFDFFQPPLTYIQQPLEEMGKESVKILLDQIKGSRKKVQVELTHRLIERASCL
ncbi:MAG: substrate-binding domain-containing protein [Mariniphaga sp.]|nr:substrate-binding domain-containing protein [Mariniphaga sp.]